MKTKKINLQLFADGVGSAETGGVSEAQDAAEQEVQNQNQETGESNEGEDRSKTWKDMIKGEFKKEYSESVQAVIDARFKQNKEMEERLADYQRVLNFVAQRYGLGEDADIDSMLNALEEDDSMFEERAAEKGLTVEQYREFHRLEQQNEQFKRAEQEAQRVRQANETYRDWMDQAEALKEIYPDFDFEDEAENNDFLQLLQNGIDVRTAYEVAHHDEIMRGAMQMASARTAERVADGIRAKGMRPAENGTHTTSKPVEQKIDISKLTKKDIEDFARRAARGEKITF